MMIEAIDEQNRAVVNEFIMSHWYSLKMVVRGMEFDMTRTDGFFVREGESGGIIGLATYIVSGDTAELMSLDSLIENRGIGTMLLSRVVEQARSRGCRRVVLITTNDNLRAIGFYQKHGFDMSAFYRNALDRSRELKPEIPLVGLDNIPLRHELEFEMLL